MKNFLHRALRFLLVVIQDFESLFSFLRLSKADFNAVLWLAGYYF